MLQKVKSQFPVRSAHLRPTYMLDKFCFVLFCLTILALSHLFKTEISWFCVYPCGFGGTGMIP